MAESKTNQILVSIAKIETNTQAIFKRLDKINGTIADYPVSKNRIDNLEKDCGEMNQSLVELSKLLSGVKIKVWGMAGLIGAIMGFAGVVIGKFI